MNMAWLRIVHAIMPEYTVRYVKKARLRQNECPDRYAESYEYACWQYVVAPAG